MAAPGDKDTRVADLVVDALSAFGVRHFFQVTGGDPALWTALDQAGIHMVACRSEAGAVYMADGYARASGGPGLVYGQHGPGAANIAAALADPYWAMSPVVSLTSSMPSSSREKHEYQDLDQLQMMAPVTHWRASIPEPTEVVRLITKALEIAVSTPGPTHVEIPRDLFGAPARKTKQMGRPQFTAVPGLRSRPDPDAIAVAANHLRRAKRPLLLAGAGVVLSGAQAELASLAGDLEIPVATSLGGKGGFNEKDELALGVIGRYSGVAANRVAREADLVVAIGCNLDGLVTDSWRLFSADARYIQIDGDRQAFEPGPGVHRLLGDARLTVNDLHMALKDLSRPREWEAWAVSARTAMRAWKEQYRVLAEAESEPLHPATVMSILQREMQQSDLLVADTGYMAAWTATMFEVDGRERQYFRAAGSLGWGLPGAIGVALARPDRRVVCVIGDGGLGYHVAELETAARNHVPLVVLVLNNGTLAFEYHIQRYIEHHVIESINDFESVDYAGIATALGTGGVRVLTADELRAALASARTLDRPLLIDVVIDREAIPPVTTYDGVLDRVL